MRERAGALEMLVRSICTPVHLIQLHPNPSNTVAPNIIFIPSPSDLIPSHPIASPSHPRPFSVCIELALSPATYRLSPFYCHLSLSSALIGLVLFPVTSRRAPLGPSDRTGNRHDGAPERIPSHPIPPPTYPSLSRPIPSHPMPFYAILFHPTLATQGAPR